MRVLTIDIGGNTVKLLATGESVPRSFPSGPALTPRQMVSGVQKLTEDWKFNAVSIGFPGRVRDNTITSEPVNLGSDWRHFDFAKAFGLPVRLMNDAAMQALGSYRSGTMLFLGFGTGVGSALVVDGQLVPMELGHLPYKKGSYESYLGLKGLQRLGIRKWRACVHEVVVKLTSALEVDDIVIGGGNVNKLDTLPQRCRAGDNALAFRGGFLLWKTQPRRRPGTTAPARRSVNRKRRK